MARNDRRQIKIGTTPNGRHVFYDTDENVFISQPTGDDTFIERPSLKALLTDCGWRIEEIDLTGGPAGEPRDQQAENEANAEARRLYDAARLKFADAWRHAQQNDENNAPGYDADTFIDFLDEQWGEYPADPIVQDMLHTYIHGGLTRQD